MRNFSFKAALRNAKKNSVLSFAKLFGISISFAVILFASGYVYYETSFDKFIPDNDKIYLCLMTGKLNSQAADFAVTSAAMAPVIVNEIPEIESALRVTARGSATLSINNKPHKVGPLFLADSNFFSFFDLPIQKIASNPFESGNNITICRSLALQIFGTVDNALNTVVKLRGDDCIITGVFDDLPKNFHLQTQVIQSLNKVNPDELRWGNQSYHTYIKTNQSIVDLDAFNFKLTKCVYSHSNSQFDAEKANSWADVIDTDDSYIIYTIEALRDVHFSNHKFCYAVTANKIYVYGAIILSLLVLLISSINYVNLTIANLTTRFKEIGIRKTNGAQNNQIAVQFLYESAMFWIIGFIIAVGLYQFGGKSLASYLSLDISISKALMIKIMLFSFFALVFFNLLTNTLPIFQISNKRILTLVKNDNTSKKSFSIKDGFVLFQFLLSALIILGSFFVQKQVNYMVNCSKGYNSENIISLSVTDLSDEKRKPFLEELKTLPAIKYAASSELYFDNDPSMNSAFFENNNNENYFHTSVLRVNSNFDKVFGLNIVEGRFFDEEKKTDFQAAIINQAALKEYSGSESLIGKDLLVDGRYKIIGIVEDFNFRSLHHNIQPLVITLSDKNPFIFAKINNSQIPMVLASLKKQWEKFNISGPFAYEFHDEVLAKHYIKDQQAKKLLFVLSLISVLIACVGLYAISFFTIVKRTKEIGIRKVNGAKISEVMALLSKDFAVWVIVAFVLASPIAYLAMNKWLQSFAYKTELGWWVFALAGSSALVIALITVSYQAYRAAVRNPVEALRYE